MAGLNAQLRLVRRGRLRVTFRPVLMWLETHANPTLRVHGVHVDLAWFQATTCGYCQYGLLVYAMEEDNGSVPIESTEVGGTEQQLRNGFICFLYCHFTVELLRFKFLGIMLVYL